MCHIAAAGICGGGFSCGGLLADIRASEAAIAAMQRREEEGIEAQMAIHRAREVKEREAAARARAEEVYEDDDEEE